MEVTKTTLENDPQHNHVATSSIVESGDGDSSVGDDDDDREDKVDDEDREDEAALMTVTDSLRLLSMEARDFYFSVPVVEKSEVPTPLEFYRDWVAPNRPVILRGAILDWPAVKKWKDNQYFRNVIGDKEVTVSVTPTGYADAALGDKFVMPEERQLTVNKFLDVIENPTAHSGVFYAQKQNSSLTEEFGEIMADIRHLDWATEAFGKQPDAVNFWLGDGRAVTSMHKDPYENIYCVVRGSKEIILQPPTDQPWLPVQSLQPAVYHHSEEGGWQVKKVEGDPVPWIVVDPLCPDVDKFPGYANSTQLKMTLNAGDVLYLPSLWFHHLRQSHGCVAVNFWYDMEFDVKYCYNNLLEKLKNIS